MGEQARWDVFMRGYLQVLQHPQATQVLVGASRRDTRSVGDDRRP